MKGARTADGKFYQRVGKVTETFLGIEDHGVFTAFVHVDYGGSRQGIGGHSLAAEDPKTHKLKHKADASVFITGVLRAAGVDSWERLRGRVVYVLFDSPEASATPVGLEPLAMERGERFLFTEMRDVHREGRVVVHADGGSCHGTRLVEGRCPSCGVAPDAQSTEFWPAVYAR